MQPTRTVTLPASDVAALLTALLILANGLSIPRKRRLDLMNTYLRIERQAGAQLPSGREAVKCS